MINVLIDMIKAGIDFFIKKKTVEQEVTKTNAEGQIEVNKEEIEKSSFHWRNFLGFVLSFIILYNWIIVPLQVPLGQLLQVLLIMVGGS